MRTLYMGKFNVILKGVQVGLQKSKNCIWETPYSHRNKNNALLTHIYFQLCNMFLPAVLLWNMLGNVSLLRNSSSTFRVLSLHHSTIKMHTQCTANTEDNITDDLLLYVRNVSQLSVLVPDHEFHHKPRFIFHISYANFYIFTVLWFIIYMNL